VNESRVVRVPASSANLGAGFDVLGMALDLYLDVGLGDVPDGARPIDRHHPATTAFSAVNGVEPPGPLWLRSSIPMARGLGFSGAARVGGAALAVVGVSEDPSADLAVDLAAERSRVLVTAARLERHGDNAAASVFGGVVAWVDGRVISLRVGPRLAGASVLAWIPDVTTSTDSSRGRLPEAVTRRDAVHNLGRMAQFVAAIEHDDPSLLDGATDDRLHQAIRLADVPGAAAALAAGVAAGAWCGWLSGSGPTVAFLVDDDLAAAVAAALPDGGHVKHLHIAARGVHVVTQLG
jgi:homoserine kinase